MLCRNTNRKVWWYSGLWPQGERCSLLALILLLTYVTLRKSILLSGEVFTRREKKLISIAPNMCTQTLEASASFQNWEVPMNSFTLLSANYGYNTAFCKIQVSCNNKNLCNSCICGSADVGSAGLADLIWAWLGQLVLLHVCLLLLWLWQQTNQGICFSWWRQRHREHVETGEAS